MIAAGKAMLSGFSAAIVLGVTSAKIRTKSVISIVTAKIPPSPHNLTAINVAITEARILTKLFPIKITPNNLSVLFSNLETLLAPLCLSLTKCLRRYLLIAIMLVSALEKKADRRIRIPIELKSIQRGISFNRR